MIKKVKWNEKLETLISEYFDYEKNNETEEANRIAKEIKEKFDLDVK